MTYMQNCAENQKNACDLIASYDCNSGKGNAISHVRLSVHLFPLNLLNRLTFELNFCNCIICAWLTTIVHQGLKVKITNQSQHKKLAPYGD